MLIKYPAPRVSFIAEEGAAICYPLSSLLSAVRSLYLASFHFFSSPCANRFSESPYRGGGPSSDPSEVIYDLAIIQKSFLSARLLGFLNSPIWWYFRLHF